MIHPKTLQKPSVVEKTASLMKNPSLLAYDRLRSATRTMITNLSNATREGDSTKSRKDE
jgi:hypothetical protein